MKRFCMILAAAAVAFMCLCGCSFNRSSDEIKPHLISQDEKEINPVRRISAVRNTRGFLGDSVDEQFDELAAMLYDGCRPDFKDAFELVKQSYSAAVDVLNTYVLNSYTDVERVHAIHDWLTYYVEYDHELYSDSASAKASDASFRPDGALLNGKAVCDGIAKAFNIMCGIEQIPCVRITGEYFDGGNYINHAWNKVKIDGVWYNVDATMDALYVPVSKKQTVKIINHGYFLLSDAAMSDSLTGCHTESGLDEVNYKCFYTYDFHKNEKLGIGDYCMEITHQAALNSVFTAVKNSKRKIGKLELKLNFDNYSADNLVLQDAYVDQITQAYALVKDKDFAFNPTKNLYPYKRYPNGVFVFLIYK